ncbi:hypothetical protein B9Z55_019977 [Caenorhabditis nigoni]|uniref:SXP/RAL-2 family protein Ani s 5-like cation-binding domain-containing protein n=1 Tax=Caenorhabditis nigoni TaxID=1611254 RepID=A0A2G5TKT9_9PELO|nr:hypothetical protein B9Z55_019977 [Caenorhabditis nigoni]
MFKIFSVLILLVVLSCAHRNPEQMKAEMAAAGVSAAGVTTISTFMEAHKPQKGGNRAAGKAEFDAMLATLTEADRAAFQKMMQNKPPRFGK